MKSSRSIGPLSGVTVIELAAQGPGPFAAMMLSDMGAEVIRVDRTDQGRGRPAKLATDVINRGRRSIGIDLKHPAGVETLLRLVETADVLIEGFRPGVTERLGLGPDECRARNPRLVYARMTGWGQEGPYASMAGHDINYIALAGVLSMIGRPGGPPVPPLNLVGDYGGGGLLLAFGVACALWERTRSGEGQVVDCAMVDGAAILSAIFFGLNASGGWSPERGTNVLDGGAPFYDVYETADGKFVSIGPIEDKFYAELLGVIGIDDEPGSDRMERRGWPAMKERIAAVFRTKTRDEWCALMEGTDVCFAPVLDLSEAPTHPQARARQAFVDIEGVTQPAPTPRFSRSKAAVQGPPVAAWEHTDEILGEMGLSAEAVAQLRDTGAVA